VFSQTDGNAVSLAHRPDIQALRAIAVGLVIAAHARVPWISGGFVGVDVFFVISGYLITGLIFRELEVTGHFDASAFYARRLKRLLPALLLVLIASGILGSIVTLPEQQLTDAAAAQAAAVWLSNFYFATRSVDYFATTPQGILFLHTWSLAVEEQFYLVWPWLLLFCYGVWKWQGAPRSTVRLWLGLGMTALLSFLLSMYLAVADPAAGFYLMPGRAWQFALGAAVWLSRGRLTSGHMSWIDSLRGRSLLNGTGLLLIFTAVVGYGENLRYPGAWALLPCLGAALVLFDVPERQPHSMLSRALMEQRQLQFMGDVSYSLYLWHWPALVLGTLVFGTAPATVCSLVVLCFLLSTASYRFVENPIHRRQFSRPRHVIVPALVAMALTVAAAGFWERRATAWLEGSELASIQAARFDLPRLYGEKCDTWTASDALTPCTFGASDAGKTVVLFGDSALAQWLPAVEETFLSRPGWKIVVLTKSACPASRVSYFYERIKAPYDVCDRWREKALNWIVEMRPALVIMGSSLYDFSDDQWLRGTRSVIEQISNTGAAVILVTPPPMPGFDGPSCLGRKIATPAWLPNRPACQSEPELRQTQRLARLLAESATGFPLVGVIDLGDQVCPEGLCRARIGEIIVFRDNQHLTAAFVRSLAPEFLSALEENRAILDVNRNLTSQRKYSTPEDDQRKSR
jgi:peptidoglycan/LPS O-acetylase OafA/YrhL